MVERREVDWNAEAAEWLRDHEGIEDLQRSPTLPSPHSPLGASGASRWLKCPGSVGLSHGVHDEEDDTFSKPGSAAHALAEYCLRRPCEPWQMIGTFMNERVEDAPEIAVDKEMADAVQVYLDALESWHPRASRNQANSFIERRFHCPSLHQFFYGTADFIFHDADAKALHVWDYKHGAGIVVEVKENPQCMYYACGALEDLGLWDDVDTVVLHIAQPRGFHYAGPIRTRSISTEDLIAWCEDVLLPGMDRALVSRDTESGEHCRFCPVRGRACPQILADFAELEKLMTEMQGKSADELSNEQLGRFADLLDMAKIAGKEHGRIMFARLQAGKTIPGRKLAAARANRKFKDGAEKAAVETFGKKRAFTAPELKSPAQIEAMPGGEAFCARWAFKPDAGLTVVKGDDARPAVSRQTKSLFTDQTKKGKK